MSDSLDEILRRVRGRVIGALLRLTGSLDLAEDAFQEAALAALVAWPARGLPDSPAAWLTTAAKNHIRDGQRHRAVAQAKASALREDDMLDPFDVDAIADDQLRLILTCCHPLLPRETQVALTLKVIAGFTTDELARAFLCPEPTMAQRLVRAKRTIDEKGLPFELADRAAIRARLEPALATVYLVFNEGHTASSGGLMRLDLQAEAVRLGRLLCELVPRDAEVFGLYALMAFSAARATTRAGADGALLLLSEQDRSRWDRALVEDGLMALQRARALGGDGVYLLQAEIAACHATAATWESTDWAAIVALYDRLLAVTRSPVVALNRAIAVGMLRGPEEALAALEPLAEPLEQYHHFHAARADCLRRLGRDPRADYEKALALTTNEAERAFLRKRLAPA